MHVHPCGMCAIVQLRLRCMPSKGQPGKDLVPPSAGLWSNFKSGLQPELIEQRLMSQEVDVFDVIVSLILSLCLLLGLSWMNALENT